MVDGLEVDLTLGLVWCERSADFVFDMKNEVLKIETKCRSPIEVNFSRPEYRNFGCDMGRIQAEYASMQLRLQTPVLAYNEGAGSGTEMTRCDIAVTR